MSITMLHRYVVVSYVVHMIQQRIERGTNKKKENKWPDDSIIPVEK